MKTGRKEIADLREFCRVVISRSVFDGASLDDADIRPLALRLGFLTETVYDPAVHGESHLCEPGDVWHVFSPVLDP